MNNYKHRLRAIARAYLKGDMYAVNYQQAMRDYVAGKGKQIMVNVALHDCLQHLNIW
jgi:hypothetical protein